MTQRASRFILEPSKALRFLWTLVGFRHHRSQVMPPGMTPTRRQPPACRPVSVPPEPAAPAVPTAAHPTPLPQCATIPLIPKELS